VDALVEVEGLKKNYRGVEALRGISFRIGPGELLGLLGPNGAGKTTTVKILSGLVAPTSGAARLFGLPSSVPEARRSLGYMPERAAPPEFLTGSECLDREGRLYGVARSERRARAAKLVSRLKLPEDVARRRVATYSKGERARLGLALALLPDPKVVLLDEPTDGLDPVGRHDVRDFLLELKAEGRAILLNSHLLSEAELCCDHVAILAQGLVVAQGETGELLAQKGSQEVVLRVVPSPSDEDLAKLAAIAKSIRRENGTLVCSLANEGDIDRLVDAVRARGLSLRELAPRRASLEQFFLDAIATPTKGTGA
jgi:ABC-2 type transport system ATP-binding protein